MSSVNRVILVGHLGADPELRYTNGGTAVCSLRIATSEQWTDKDGNKQERTEWHQISVWGKQAEHCGQCLAKGRQVYVEGRLQSREYTDKEGINRRAWEIQADKVNFLGGGRDEGGGQTGGGGGGGRGGSGSGSGSGGGGGNRGGQGGGGGGNGGGWGQGGGSGGGGRQGGGQGGQNRGGGQGGGGGKPQGGGDGWGGGGGFDGEDPPF